MKNIKIKQHDIKDCGAACMASIGNFYNINLPIARIRQLAHTDKRCTNLLGLIEAAEKMGFTAKGVIFYIFYGKNNLWFDNFIFCLKLIPNIFIK